MPAPIPQRLARSFVQRREPFKAANLFANWVTPTAYVVYSYGEHWPLFVYDQTIDAWFENKSRFSATTSHHHSKTHPLCVTNPLRIEQVQALISELKNTDATITNAKSGITVNDGANETLVA
jgi:hypothetical protein